MPEDEFQFLPDSRPSEEEFDGESWTWVRGGGLEQPLYARIGWSADGRPVITGLLLGAGGGAEITSSTLRSVRVGALLEQLFAGFTLDSFPKYGDLDDELEWALMQQTYVAGAPKLPDDSRAAARGAGNELLADFARRYSEEIVRNPRRAMTTTAEAFHISRATANRWAERCRDIGLLPPREDV